MVDPDLCGIGNLRVRCATETGIWFRNSLAQPIPGRHFSTSTWSRARFALICLRVPVWFGDPSLSDPVGFCVDTGHRFATGTRVYFRAEAHGAFGEMGRIDFAREFVGDPSAVAGQLSLDWTVHGFYKCRR